MTSSLLPRVRYFAMPRFIASLLVLVFTANLATASPTQQDQAAAMKAVKGFVAAESKGDMRAAARYVDPKILQFTGRLTGMSSQQVIEFMAVEFEKHVVRSSIRITPYYNNAKWEQTRSGRIFMKLPVKVQSQGTPQYARNGILTYLVYEANGKWYVADLKPGTDFWLFKRIYPEFKRVKLYKYD